MHRFSFETKRAKRAAAFILALVIFIANMSGRIGIVQASGLNFEKEETEAILQQYQSEGLFINIGERENTSGGNTTGSALYIDYYQDSYVNLQGFVDDDSSDVRYDEPKVFESGKDITFSVSFALNEIVGVFRNTHVFIEIPDTIDPDSIVPGEFVQGQTTVVKQNGKTMIVLYFQRDVEAGYNYSLSWKGSFKPEVTPADTESQTNVHLYSELWTRVSESSALEFEAVYVSDAAFKVKSTAKANWFVKKETVGMPELGSVVEGAEIKETVTFTYALDVLREETIGSIGSIGAEIIEVVDDLPIPEVSNKKPLKAEVLPGLYSDRAVVSADYSKITWAGEKAFTMEDFTGGDPGQSTTQYRLKSDGDSAPIMIEVTYYLDDLKIPEEQYDPDGNDGKISSYQLINSAYANFKNFGGEELIKGTPGTAETEIKYAKGHETKAIGLKKSAVKEESGINFDYDQLLTTPQELVFGIDIWNEGQSKVDYVLRDDGAGKNETLVSNTTLLKFTNSVGQIIDGYEIGDEYILAGLKIPVFNPTKISEVEVYKKEADGNFSLYKSISESIEDTELTEQEVSDWYGFKIIAKDMIGGYKLEGIQAIFETVPSKISLPIIANNGTEAVDTAKIVKSIDNTAYATFEGRDNKDGWLWSGDSIGVDYAVPELEITKAGITGKLDLKDLMGNEQKVEYEIGITTPDYELKDVVIKDIGLQMGDEVNLEYKFTDVKVVDGTYTGASPAVIAWDNNETKQKCTITLPTLNVTDSVKIKVSAKVKVISYSETAPSEIKNSINYTYNYKGLSMGGTADGIVEVNNAEGFSIKKEVMDGYETISLHGSGGGLYSEDQEVKFKVTVINNGQVPVKYTLTDAKPLFLKDKTDVSESYTFKFTKVELPLYDRERFPGNPSARKDIELPTISEGGADAIEVVFNTLPVGAQYDVIVTGKISKIANTVKPSEVFDKLENWAEGRIAEQPEQVARADASVSVNPVEVKIVNVTKTHTRGEGAFDVTELAGQTTEYTIRGEIYSSISLSNITITDLGPELLDADKKELVLTGDKKKENYVWIESVKVPDYSAFNAAGGVYFQYKTAPEDTDFITVSEPVTGATKFKVGEGPLSGVAKISQFRIVLQNVPQNALEDAENPVTLPDIKTTVKYADNLADLTDARNDPTKKPSGLCGMRNKAEISYAWETGSGPGPGEPVVVNADVITVYENIPGASIVKSVTTPSKKPMDIKDARGENRGIGGNITYNLAVTSTPVALDKILVYDDGLKAQNNANGSDYVNLNSIDGYKFTGVEINNLLPGGVPTEGFNFKLYYVGNAIGVDGVYNVKEKKFTFKLPDGADIKTFILEAEPKTNDGKLPKGLGFTVKATANVSDPTLSDSLIKIWNRASLDYIYNKSLQDAEKSVAFVDITKKLSGSISKTSDDRLELNDLINGNKPVNYNLTVSNTSGIEAKFVLTDENVKFVTAAKETITLGAGEYTFKSITLPTALVDLGAVVKFKNFSSVELTPITESLTDGTKYTVDSDAKGFEVTVEKMPRNISYTLSAELLLKQRPYDPAKEPTVLHNSASIKVTADGSDPHNSTVTKVTQVTSAGIARGADIKKTVDNQNLNAVNVQAGTGNELVYTLSQLGHSDKSGSPMTDYKLTDTNVVIKDNNRNIVYPTDSGSALKDKDIFWFEKILFTKHKAVGTELNVTIKVFNDDGTIGEVRRTWSSDANLEVKTSDADLGGRMIAGFEATASGLPTTFTDETVTLYARLIEGNVIVNDYKTITNTAKQTGKFSGREISDEGSAVTELIARGIPDFTRITKTSSDVIDKTSWYLEDQHVSFQIKGIHNNEDGDLAYLQINDDGLAFNKADKSTREPNDGEVNITGVTLTMDTGRGYLSQNRIKDGYQVKVKFIPYGKTADQVTYSTVVWEPKNALHCAIVPDEPNTSYKGFEIYTENMPSSFGFHADVDVTLKKKDVDTEIIDVTQLENKLSVNYKKGLITGTVSDIEKAVVNIKDNAQRVHIYKRLQQPDLLYTPTSDVQPIWEIYVTNIQKDDGTRKSAYIDPVVLDILPHVFNLSDKETSYEVQYGKTMKNGKVAIGENGALDITEFVETDIGIQSASGATPEITTVPGKSQHDEKIKNSLLIWNFTGKLEYGETIKITVNSRLSKYAEPCTAVNTAFTSSKKQTLETTPGLTVKKGDDKYNGYGLDQARAVSGYDVLYWDEAQANIKTDNTVMIVKKVNGSLDFEDTWTSEPNVGHTEPGGWATYRISATNYTSDGNKVKDVRFVDLLPHSGDHSIININRSRKTEWSPTLSEVGPLQLYYQGKNITEQKLSSYKIYVTESENVNAEADIKNGIDHTKWQELDAYKAVNSENLSKVKGVLVDVPDFELGTNETLSVDLKMNIPDSLAEDFDLKTSTQDQKISDSVRPTAWNTVALGYSAGKTKSAKYGPLEPNKVGIVPMVSMLGNFVWFDANDNGLQDSGEKGAEGVTVYLFRTGEDGNILAEDKAGGYKKTVTNENGYYEFDKLSTGYYKVGFEEKPEFSYTSKLEVGENPAKDSNVAQSSDQMIIEGAKVLITKTIDLPMDYFDTTWDAGIVATDIDIHKEISAPYDGDEYAGEKFELEFVGYFSDGSGVKTIELVRNDTVKANFLLPGHSYTVREIGPDAGKYTFILTGVGVAVNADGSYEMTMPTDVNKFGDIVVNVINTRKTGGKLTVKKAVLNANNMPETNNKDIFTFVVTGPGGYKTEFSITGNGSHQLTGLDYGVYTVKETGGNPHYVSSGEGIVTISGKEQQEITIANVRKKAGRLIIVKEVTNNGEAVSSKEKFQFTVTGPDGAYKLTVSPESPGILEDIPVGHYTIEETGANTSNYKVTMTSQDFLITKDGTAKAKFELGRNFGETGASMKVVNDLCRDGKLKVTKEYFSKSSEGIVTQVSDWGTSSFVITITGIKTGTTQQVTLTSGKRSHTFTGLPFDEYRVTEGATGNNISVWIDIPQVVISAENPERAVMVRNTLQHNKKDDGRKEPTIPPGESTPPSTPPSESTPPSTPPSESTPPSTPPSESTPPTSPPSRVDDNETPSGTTEVPRVESVPVVEEVPAEEIIYADALPQGYTMVQTDDNTYVIYDEDGTPLGFVVVPEGMNIDDIDIMDELIPFGAPETSKVNPKTGDRSGSPIINILCLAVMAFTVALEAKDHCRGRIKSARRKTI